MKYKLLFINYCIFLTAGQGVLAESRTNFQVIKCEKCFTNGPVDYSLNITKQHHQQYLDFYLKSPIDLDRNIGMDVIIESSLDTRTFLWLFTIHEKDFCKAANKYMGEFWYDIERVAQIPVGVCPVRANTYRVHHHLLNFEKITLQTFPFGILRLTLRGIQKTTKKTVFCQVLEVENYPN